MNKLHQQSPTNSGGVDSQSFGQSPSDTRTEKTETTVVESESRSYDPYLIAYDEETNSFTYNDPWIQVDLTNGSCCDDEIEIVCDVSESDSYEPPQPDMETESAEYRAVPMLEVTTAHEHEPEVSFHATATQHSIQSKRFGFLSDQKPFLNYPFPRRKVRLRLIVKLIVIITRLWWKAIFRR